MGYILLSCILVEGCKILPNALNGVLAGEIILISPTFSQKKSSKMLLKLKISSFLFDI